MSLRILKGRRGRRGGALLLALVATVLLAGMAGAVITISGSSKKESVAATGDMRALYVAEAGVSQGIQSLQGGVTGAFGQPNAIAFGGGQYWGTVTDNGDDTATVTAFASVDAQTRGLEATLTREGEPIFETALFAGNSSGDPNYDLKFGGKNAQADQINGNVYSGGNVKITGNATVTGDIKAAGTISGGSGSSGTKSPPDLAAMDYATQNDVNVATAFSSGATYATNALGGKAWQLPESNPAHIFRKNPNDRTANTSSTVKDDYFLEDPYESVKTSSTVAPANGTRITLSGADNNPGSDGNNLVYYIDGNLWVHNLNIFSFTLYNNNGKAVKATFVVKGNIYVSDNILYHDGNNDALALIAMKDPNVTDSGNIYFGDPTFGTLEQMDSFMYAENNFYDSNLNSTGSAKVTVNGNMTAGNQVLINRDYGNQHSKLTVNYDPRIAQGTISLPGLPGSGGGGMTWEVAAWREVSAP